MFDPNEYIQVLDDHLVLCSNPVADGGLSAITVNLSLSEERKAAFCESIKRMVLNKLFSPKFAEVIFSAMEVRVPQLRLA
jgi:hypothetical protein